MPRRNGGEEFPAPGIGIGTSRGQPDAPDLAARVSDSRRQSFQRNPNLEAGTILGGSVFRCVRGFIIACTRTRRFPRPDSGRRSHSYEHNARLRCCFGLAKLCDGNACKLPR